MLKPDRGLALSMPKGRPVDGRGKVANISLCCFAVGAASDHDRLENLDGISAYNPGGIRVARRRSRKLGFVILDASSFFRTTYVFSGIILIGAIGLIGDQIIAWLARRIVHWEGKR